MQAQTAKPESKLRFVYVALVSLALVVSLTSVGVNQINWGVAKKRQRAAWNLEAQILSMEVASKIAACSDRDRILPKPSRPVPEHLPGLVPYSSTEADWNQDVFRCAGFRLLRPQRVRLGWRPWNARDRGYDEAGMVMAEGDSDEDGVMDYYRATEAACAKAQCTVAPMAY